MTEGTGRGLPIRTEMVAIALLAIMALGVVWYLLAEGEQELRRSPVGMDGLRIWLNQEGVSAQSFTGGWVLDPQNIGLLIVPLYDTLPGSPRVRPTTKEELLLQQDEFDQPYGPIEEKIRGAYTIVVLPKWRSGMRLTGLAHPVLLDQTARIEAILRHLTGDDAARLSRSPQPFSDFSYEGSTARLYVAQTFSSPGCKPVVGDEDHILIGECMLGGDDDEYFAVIADPDLLNNHGLRLGQNAVLVRDFLDEWAEGSTVVIDYSAQSWLTDPAATKVPARTWADLARYFGPPFTVPWLGALALLALAVWRGAIRYGPALTSAPGLGASSIAAIGARARLMRRTGRDGEMLGDYAAARVASLAARLLGPGRARDESALLRALARQNPAAAEELTDQLARLRRLPARVKPAEAIRHLDAFEHSLDQIAHDT